MKSITCQVTKRNNLKLRLANNLMKCESLGITSGTLKHQYLHGMSLNELVNLTAKVNFRRKFRVDLLPILNVTLSIKRMFSNKPQLGLPQHYSFDIYSIRIPPTAQAYQGQQFDFLKVVSSKTNKKWRLMELFRLPSVRRIFLRASVYKASPGARLRACDRSPY